MSSFEPKNEQKYFCISVLAPKMGKIIKTMAHYPSNTIIFILFFDLTYLREVGQKYRNVFVHFLVEMNTSKSLSEIK